MEQKKAYSKKRRGYVYLFLNDSDTVVYVGSTGNIDSRMYQHFSSVGGRFHLDKPRKIRYCELPSRNDALIAETVLIQKYKPLKNTVSVDDGAVSLSTFCETDYEWVEKTPDEFQRKPSTRKAIRSEDERCESKHNAAVFCALREMFPNADLRRTSITKHQKHCLHIALMSDFDYWASRMTDFEWQLAAEQFSEELARLGVYCG